MFAYVDNILLTSNSKDEIQHVKQFLHKKFTIKDLGESDFFLGIQLQHNTKGILMSQQKFTLISYKNII